MRALRDIAPSARRPRARWRTPALPHAHSPWRGGSRSNARGERSDAWQRIGLLLALVVVLTLLSSPALAQSLGPLSGSGKTTQLVESGPALEAARRSFSVAAEARREAIASEREIGPELQARFDEIVAEVEESFARESELTVTELEGDGALTFDELTRALETLRTDHLTRLTNRLDAAARGIDPPPTVEGTRTVGDYVGRFLEYTLIERNPPRRWLGLFACVAGGLLLAWLISKALGLLVSGVRRWFRQRVLEELLGTLIGPLYLATALAGVGAGLSFIWMPATAEEVVWVLLRLAFVAAGYWFFWNLSGALTATFARAARSRRNTIDSQVLDVMRKGLRLFVTLVFVLFVTEVVFQSDIEGLLAGIGIAGLALSLAAQDTLKNVIASFTIFGDRPFVLGDFVIYDGKFGKVEAIGFRSTRVREFDGHLLTIPNAELVATEIENVSARPYIRRRFYVALPYGTPPDKVRRAQEVLREILDAKDYWHQDFEPKVEFVRFGPYSLDLMVEYRQVPPDYWGAFTRDTEINLEIIERFAAEEIEFAFPTRQVVLEHKEEDPGQPRGDAPGELP